MDYAKLFAEFPGDICGDLADLWIKLLEPKVDYSGQNPPWFPKDLTLMKPQQMLKQDQVSLLQYLVCENLFQRLTQNALNEEAQKIWRLRSSPIHQKTLSKILDAFQAHQQQPNGSLDPVRNHRLATQIIDVDQASSGVVFDLTFDFAVEWKTYSAEGGSLHAATTPCALHNGQLVPREGMIPRELQSPLVGQEVLKDNRIGILKIVAANEKMPGRSISLPPYVAFSIRVAVSVSHGYPFSASAKGWEDVPRMIVEIEAQKWDSNVFSAS